MVPKRALIEFTNSRRWLFHADNYSVEGTRKPGQSLQLATLSNLAEEERRVFHCEFIILSRGCGVVAPRQE